MRPTFTSGVTTFLPEYPAGEATLAGDSAVEAVEAPGLKTSAAVDATVDRPGQRSGEVVGAAVEAISLRSSSTPATLWPRPTRRSTTAVTILRCFGPAALEEAAQADSRGGSASSL